eukprot:1144656-Rhodomonas_salina.1
MLLSSTIDVQSGILGCVCLISQCSCLRRACAPQQGQKPNTISPRNRKQHYTACIHLVALSWISGAVPFVPHARFPDKEADGLEAERGIDVYDVLSTRWSLRVGTVWPGIQS